MFSFFKKTDEKAGGTKRVSHGDTFSLLIPTYWKQNAHSEYLSVSAPADAASVTANAYAKVDGSLSDFAEYRFSSVQDFYTQVGDERRFTANGLAIVLREYQGTWPGERKPTYYVVTCIKAQGLYISLSITTTRDEFTKNKRLYEEIIESVQPVA